MGSRFDYVAYDSVASDLQNQAKKQVQELGVLIESLGRSQGLPPANVARAKALAFTKLEEVYMWIGKAVRDDQIARNGSAPLQESRTNS